MIDEIGSVLVMLSGLSVIGFSIFCVKTANIADKIMIFAIGSVLLTSGIIGIH